MDIDAQPNATALPQDLIDSLIENVVPNAGSISPVEVRHLDKHSNDLCRIRFPDGRTLMAKRGRYDWAADRFETSRIASRLLRESTELVVPAPLDVPDDLDSQPLEVYWRVDLPTLQELWREIPDVDRSDVLQSLGRLIRDLHQVRLSGHGPLRQNARFGTLQEFLEADLAGRLRPAVAHLWPDGLRSVDRLIDSIPSAASRVGEKNRVLVHNDLHAGNVLCDVSHGGTHCVGLLDLEDAVVGPREMDMANLQILHGPMFEQRLPDGWFEQVQIGYGVPLDDFLLQYFRGYHLSNMGFYSALVGHHEHASWVAEATWREAEALT